jgi:hypothetical protein
LVVALGASACSSLQPVKEIVTVPTVVDSPQIEAPAIRIVPRPDPVELKNADLIVVTESNIDEVIQRVKTEQGDFVLYSMTAQSFESLALNFEQIKKFIEEQNAIILYYEEAVTPKDD